MGRSAPAVSLSVPRCALCYGKVGQFPAPGLGLRIVFLRSARDALANQPGQDQTEPFIP